MSVYDQRLSGFEVPREEPDSFFWSSSWELKKYISGEFPLTRSVPFEEFGWKRFVPNRHRSLADLRIG